jgi:hypothetical protein
MQGKEKLGEFCRRNTGDAIEDADSPASIPDIGHQDGRFLLLIRCQRQ